MDSYTERNEKRAAVHRRKGKKGAFAALAAVLLCALGGWFWYSGTKAEKERVFSFETNSERVKFLNRQGLIVEPEPERTEVTIPETFDSTYEEYNALQREQGFDLSGYRGVKVTMYSYTVLNWPDHPDNVYADMLCDDHTLIGCDVMYKDSEDGFTAALITNTADLSESMEG